MHHRARRQLQFQHCRSIHGGVARVATIRRWQPRQQYSMIYLETRSYGQHVSPQSSVYYNDHAFSLFLPLMRAHCPSLALPLGVSLEPMFLLLVSLPSLALAPAVSLSLPLSYAYSLSRSLARRIALSFFLFLTPPFPPPLHMCTHARLHKYVHANPYQYARCICLRACVSDCECMCMFFFVCACVRVHACACACV